MVIAELCFFLMKFPECFPVSIDKALTYVSAETYVEERLPAKPLQYTGLPMADAINVDVDLDAEIVDSTGVEDVTATIDKLFGVQSTESGSTVGQAKSATTPEITFPESKIEQPVPKFPFTSYPPYAVDVELGTYRHMIECRESHIKLREHQVPGDGNCQFASLIYASGIN